MSYYMQGVHICACPIIIGFLQLQVPDLEMTEILNAEEYPNVVHGTRYTAWNIISKEVSVVCSSL